MDAQDLEHMPMDAEPPSLTVRAQAILLQASHFRQGVDVIRDTLLSASVRDYFAALLARHGLQLHEAVRGAELDRDYGRQLLIGERMGRRDYYIQLAFGMRLTVEETQSMLSYLGIGPLYALRKRDAAVMYALREGYALMDAQLLLDEHGLTPLGDAEDGCPDQRKPAGTQAIRTRDMEQRLKNARDFETLSEEMNDHFTSIGVNTYFTRLLTARNMTRRQVIDLAGLGDKSNLAFQLLNGTRTARNRDLYLRFALAMGLTLDETQSMLKFLKKGPLYPLKMRDAALVYAISHRFDLAETQRLLEENDLSAL